MGFRVFKRERRGLGLFQAAALAMGLGASSARAEESAAEILDVSLLKAGAIVVADVASIKQAPGNSVLAEVELSNVKVVSNRFARVPSKFRVKGAATGGGNRASVTARGFGAINVGARYIMFLHSGPWTHSPFESGPESVYLVESGSGFVTCGSGYVLGTDPNGVICGEVDVKVIPPLTESEFITRLNALYKGAVARRPALAAKLAAAHHEFALDPIR